MFFASDIDNTLVSAKMKYADGYIIDNLNKIIAEGHIVCLVSGRSINELKIDEKLWNLHAYVIFMNGSIILDPYRNVIYQNVITKDNVSKLYDMYHDMPFEYLSNDHKFVCCDSDTFLNNLKANLNINDFDKDLMETLLNQLCQSISFNTDVDTLVANDIYLLDLIVNNQNFCLKLSSEIYDNFDDLEVYYINNSLQISSMYIDKAIALNILISQLNIVENDVYVFGDSINDYTMLKTFKHSYAVNNSSVEAKKVASEIIKSVDEYGVITKIREIIDEKAHS